MSHVLIDRLIDELGYARVTLDNHDEFVAMPGMNLLFFPGDPTTVKDATDVAVVLPELLKIFDGQLKPGVITDTFGDGTALKRHYGFSHDLPHPGLGRVPGQDQQSARRAAKEGARLHYPGRD
jgi:hydrogenase-1 operon protein HyaE